MLGNRPQEGPGDREEALGGGLERKLGENGQFKPLEGRVA